MYYIVIIVLSLIGCAAKPAVRMDVDTYVKNRGQYKTTNILITADIGDLVKHTDLLRGAEVEVAGLVSYFGTNNFWTWYVLLEKGGHTIRCYAHQYRVEPGRDALQLVRWAKTEHGEITISGTLKNDGIAIRYISYKGDRVTPYYKPSDHYFLPWWPLAR